MEFAKYVEFSVLGVPWLGSLRKVAPPPKKKKIAGSANELIVAKAVLWFVAANILRGKVTCRPDGMTWADLGRPSARRCPNDCDRCLPLMLQTRYAPFFVSKEKLNSHHHHDSLGRNLSRRVIQGWRFLWWCYTRVDAKWPACRCDLPPAPNVSAVPPRGVGCMYIK